MSAVDLSKAPYYDKYDRTKNYTQLLAVPGRVAQAREITEMQSTIKDIIKSLGDSIMNDGDIIEGCQVSIDKEKKIVAVTSGRVYMRGLVLDLPESEISITAEGEEIIGIKLVESIYHYNGDDANYNDSDLMDPALGYQNYGQPGMDRLKSEIVVVKITESDLADPDAKLATLVTLEDGEIPLEKLAPNYSTLNETLARRTYDESGSYIVEGLEVRVESNSDDTFNVVVEPGKAYVHGYELVIPSARRISLPRATTPEVNSISLPYKEGQTEYRLMTGPYLAGITSIKGQLEFTEQVNISNANGARLSRDAREITKVIKGGVEINSSNYHLEQGNVPYIKWNNTSYPGTDVTVTYHYERELVQGTDYNLVNRDTNPSVQILGNLIDKTPINITYDKYLARKDTVYLDQYGTVDVVQGTPADYGLEVTPDSPTYTLPLASVSSPPGGVVDPSNTYLDIGVSNVGLTRFTMNDIHKLLRRVRTIEYDQTILSLNTEAKEYATDDKKGIFTDPFIDLSKLSMEFNLKDGAPISNMSPTFDVGVDLDNNMITLPLINQYADMIYNEGSSTSTKHDTTVTLEKLSERIVLSQMNATKSFLIAPYISQPQTPEVHIDPSLDTWYDDTIITVPVSIYNSQVVSTSSRNLFSSQIDTSFHQNGLRTDTYTGTVTTYSAVGTTTEQLVSDSIIKESMVNFIRQRDITVKGLNYPSNLDNIKCYFEGVYAPMTPINSTVSGTDSGSVRSNSNGSFEAKFTIPSNITTGTRVVTFKSDIEIEGYQSSAYAFYKATGIARTIQRTITTITTVLLHRTDIDMYESYYYDPLAQTFILEKNTLLNSIDIYFENLPDANLPVTCEIREVSNGNITGTIYGTKTLMSDNIRDSVSADSSKATRFTFADPVLCEANKEYAFVLKANSKDFRVWVAEIGETDIQTKQTVMNNPYVQGVMMSSSNNSSWTTHQKADVKFRLIANTYKEESVVHFNNLTLSEGFCRFNLAAESLVFENTSIDWYYSVDEGATWSYIAPYNNRVLNDIKNKIQVKAIMKKSTNVDISPVLNLNSVSMRLACYDSAESTPRYYVSKLISGLDPYDTVELIIDTYGVDDNTNPDTTLTPYVSVQSTNTPTLYPLKENTLKRKELSNGWTERTYETDNKLPKSNQCRLFVKLTSKYKYKTPAFRRLRSIMSERL